MATIKSSVAALLAILTGASLAGAVFADTLVVTKAGSGSGTVTSNDGAINCGATCSDNYTTGTPITLTATPDGSSQFTGWLGPCTGASTCQFTINGDTTAVATFAPAALGAPTLDVDGNAAFNAPTDAVLIIRYLFGLTGAALIDGAVGPGATRNTAAKIETYLTDIRPALDIDGNGQVDALTDGLLIMRYLFGLRDASLITGAVGPGATRTTAFDLETSLSGFGNDRCRRIPPPSHRHWTRRCRRAFSRGQGLSTPVRRRSRRVLRRARSKRHAPRWYAGKC